MPAKRIKSRFSDNQIKELLELKWWQYFFKDFGDIDSDIGIEGFIYRIKTKVETGQLKPWNPRILTGQMIIDTLEK